MVGMGRLRHIDYALLPMNPVDLYLRVRQREGRLYPDEIVIRLPEVPRTHPLWEEWQLRATSCRRLIRYLARRGQPLDILDVGCGNGWLTHKLAEIPQCRVWGLERGGSELEQAARLFRNPRLGFLCTDIFYAPFTPWSFDVIILASVIQYFPDLPGLIRILHALLRPGGEIHILDSPLYPESEIPAAQQRTRAHYTSLGLPEMAEYYYHHPISVLADFSPRWLYRPQGLRPRLMRLLGQWVSPFPWIVLG